MEAAPSLEAAFPLQKFSQTALKIYLWESGQMDKDYRDTTGDSGMVMIGRLYSFLSACNTSKVGRGCGSLCTCLNLDNYSNLISEFETDSLASAEN